MLKLQRNLSFEAKDMRLCDIPVGTTFTGNIDTAYVNVLFLRIHDGLVSLDDPRLTWTSCNQLRITNYRPVDIVGTVVREL